MFENFIKDIRYSRIKEIKVTPDCYNYLTAKCRENIYLVNDENFPAYIMGIPIVIDDTINNPYELVYTRGNNK